MRLCARDEERDGEGAGRPSSQRKVSERVQGEKRGRVSSQTHQRVATSPSQEEVVCESSVFEVSNMYNFTHGGMLCVMHFSSHLEGFVPVCWNEYRYASVYVCGCFSIHKCDNNNNT